jgi:hypothetical protein
MNKPKVFIYTPVDKSGGSHKQLEAAGCELKLSDISWHKLTGDMDIIGEVEENPELEIVRHAAGYRIIKRLLV